jgi:mRNA interferase YafQ
MRLIHLYERINYEDSLKAAGPCSAGYNVRIVFEYIQHEGAEAVLLLSLGTHDQVY